MFNIRKCAEQKVRKVREEIKMLEAEILSKARHISIIHREIEALNSELKPLEAELYPKETVDLCTNGKSPGHEVGRSEGYIRSPRPERES